jgi:hypothetical protein
LMVWQSSISISWLIRTPLRLKKIVIVFMGLMLSFLGLS